MRSIRSAIGPCLVIPSVLFIMLHYPALENELLQRSPLVPALDVARQLDARIAYVESLNKDLPAPYSGILAEYGGIPAADELVLLHDLSRSVRRLSTAEKLLARFLLWRHNLPGDLLSADPVGWTIDRLDAITAKEKEASVQRGQMVFNHVLECLRHELPKPPPRTASRIGFPPGISEKGLLFCEEPIPLEREDVRRRVAYQVDYLLNDFRDTTAAWLKRKDRYAKVVEAILAKEGVPKEFSLMPALESGYDGTAASASRAQGWWQFLRPTALRAGSADKDLDWSLQIGQHKDERRDLPLSTRSAARYLKWIRSRLSSEGKPAGWLLTAAAYNAGLSETSFRAASYQTTGYWDMKLPRETEDYVPRWIALYLIDSYREFYCIDLPKISPVEFETLHGVKLNKDLPVTFLAAITGSSVRFLREINGTLTGEVQTYKAKVDDVEVIHTIHIPKGCAKSVRIALVAQGYWKEGM